MAGSGLQRELLAVLDTGDLARIRELLAAGADVNRASDDPDGETPLIRAVKQRQLPLVQMLLQAGADPNLPQKGPRAWTPLMFAHDQPVVLRELISAGANLDARTPLRNVVSPISGSKKRRGGETVLHLAAAANHVDAVKLLLQAGADPETGAENGCAPVDYALRTGSITAAAEALVAAGAELTPERLLAMHSGAHRGDSDLFEFPFLTGTESGTRGREDNTSPDDGTEPSPASNVQGGTSAKEIKCPRCQALLYSRRTRICDQCGEALPAELVLSDELIKARQEQRRWARDLADVFSTEGSSQAGTGQQARPKCEEDVTTESPSPQALLCGRSFAEEHKNRDRRTFWIYALGYGVLLLTLSFISFSGLGTQAASGAFAILAILGVLGCYRAWNKTTPICPNCKQNIRFCKAIYCHVCGGRLSFQRCERCRVDNSWTSFFRPQTGNYSRITFCPGCGARLESNTFRWRAGRGLLERV